MMFLLLFLLVVYTFAAPESRVRLNDDTFDRCATYIDSGCFGDVSLYKAHFNAYYNEIPTTRTCMRRKMKRDVFVKAAKGYHMDLKKKEWKNNAIPYLISCKYTESERIFIANAMMAIESRTCMKFVPYEGRGELLVYVDIDPPADTNCSAGMNGFWPMTYNGEWKQYAKLSYRRLCFNNPDGRGKNSLIHELMHVLGFMHQQDRTDAYPFPGGADPSEYVTFGPYDRFSAVSYSWTRELTDLDAFKINRLYNCSRTARGNLPIDLSKPTPPPKRLAGLLKTVDIDCPWSIKKAYTNVAHIIVDEPNVTITLENQFNEQRTQCEIDEKCYLPFIHYRADGKLINNRNIPMSSNAKCMTFSLGDRVQPHYRSPMFYDKCIAVIQGNIAPGRGGPRFICLVSLVDYKLAVNVQVLTK